MTTAAPELSDAEKAVYKKIIKKGRTASEVAEMLGYDSGGRAIGRPLGKLVKLGLVQKITEDKGKKLTVPQYAKIS